MRKWRNTYRFNKHVLFEFIKCFVWN